MRAVFSLGVSVCSVGSIAAMWMAFCPERAIPDIDVSPSPFQRIAAVRQGTEESVHYSLTNRTSETVRIVNVVTSCLCSEVRLPKRVLTPKEAVPLTVIFDSGSARGTLTIRGSLTYLRTNDDTFGVVPFGVQATVDPDYLVEPEELCFGKGRPLVQKISISPHHTDNVNIDSVACNLRFLSARVVPNCASDNTRVVEVSFHDDGYYAAAGPARLSVKTDSERQPVLTIPITVLRNGPDVVLDAGD